MSNTVVTIPAPPASTATAWPGVNLWHENAGIGFHDLLDTINPLQHIPIVGTVYRAITDDQPGAVPRVVGDGLFGGLFGLIGGLVDVLVQAESGKDIGEHALALVGLDGSGGDKATATAANGAPAVASGRGSGRAPMPLSPSRYILPTAASAAGGSTAGVLPAMPGSATATGPQLVQKPVPLHGVGLLLPNARPRPLFPAAAKAPPAGPPNAAAIVPSATPASPPAKPTLGPDGLPQNPPVEISQRMMDALDKYERMIQQRQGKPGAGGQLNVVQ